MRQLETMKKLKDTWQIPEGSILRVYRPGFGYARLQLIDSTDQFLGALAPEDFFEAVTDGDAIECYLWIEHDASYECTLNVIGRISRGKHILFLEHSKSIRRSKERHCLTAKVSLPFRYFSFSSGYSGKNFKSEEPVFHDGTITSLNDREMTFQGNEKTAEGAFLFGHLIIPGGHRLDLAGKITAASTNGTTQVALTGLQERDRTRLLDYIFTIYRD